MPGNVKQYYFSTSGSISLPSTIDSTLASSSSAASSDVNSLLSHLHRPTSSELSWKRKVNKHSQGASASDPKSVTSFQHLNQYTSENMTVSNKKLFVSESLVVTYHIKNAKHISSKKKIETKRKADLEIVESLRSQDELDPYKSVSSKSSLYLLSAGVSLNKITEFRDFKSMHFV